MKTAPAARAANGEETVSGDLVLQMIQREIALASSGGMDQAGLDGSGADQANVVSPVFAPNLKAISGGSDGTMCVLSATGIWFRYPEAGATVRSPGDEGKFPVAHGFDDPILCEQGTPTGDKPARRKERGDIRTQRAMPFSQLRTSRPIPYLLKRSAHSSHAAILDAIPVVGAGRKVLDLGCSTGYLGAELATRGYEVLGVEKAGGAGRGFPSGVRLLEHDLELGIPDSVGHDFDYIVCADILEHLRDPASLLTEIANHLSPSGIVIASLPNSGHAYFRWEVLSGRFPQEDRGLFDKTHLRFYVWAGWSALFAGAGLTIETVRPTSVPVGLAYPRLPKALAEAFELLSVWLARIWRTLFAYQFVVVAVRSCNSK
ncbi:MAG: class I SAM-dependent methyltransferase [Bryobacterales bacterium]|nr:class I SAM-dependent methyltransferase [Bryobacterales bacterium]